MNSRKWPDDRVITSSTLSHFIKERKKEGKKEGKKDRYDVPLF